MNLEILYHHISEIDGVEEYVKAHARVAMVLGEDVSDKVAKLTTTIQRAINSHNEAEIKLEAARVQLAAVQDVVADAGTNIFLRPNGEAIADKKMKQANQAIIKHIILVDQTNAKLPDPYRSFHFGPPQPKPQP